MNKNPYGEGLKITVMFNLKQWELIPFVMEHPVVDCKKLNFLFFSLRWGTWGTKKDGAIDLNSFLPPELR